MWHPPLPWWAWLIGLLCGAPMAVGVWLGLRMHRDHQEAMRLQVEHTRATVEGWEAVDERLAAVERELAQLRDRLRP